MKTFCIAISVVASSFAQVAAQVKANNELRSLIGVSFTYFPRVKEVENTILTAKEKIDLVGIDKPTVDGNLSYRYVRPKIEVPIGGSAFQFAPVNNVDGNIAASYQPYDFGRIKANVEKAKTELRYAEHNVMAVKSQLAAQVASIYYNRIFLKKAISIQDTVLAFLKDNEKFVQSKLANGDALKIDLLNIRSQIDAESNRKVDLESNLRKQNILLSYATGKDNANGNDFDFEVPMLDEGAAMAESKANNPDFVLAKDKVEQAKADVAIARLTNKPIVSLGAQTGLKNGYVPNVNEIRFNYNAGVALKVPIYEGGRTKKQVQLSQTVVSQNQLAAGSLENTYKKDIAQAIDDIRSNLERINNTKGQIEQSKYAKTLAEARFRNGAGTHIELTNANSNVQRALLTRLQYEYQACLAKVELARLTGAKYW